MVSKKQIESELVRYDGKVPEGCGSLEMPENSKCFSWLWKSPEGDEYSSIPYPNYKDRLLDWKKIEDKYFNRFYDMIVEMYKSEKEYKETLKLNN